MIKEKARGHACCERTSGARLRGRWAKPDRMELPFRLKGLRGLFVKAWKVDVPTLLVVLHAHAYEDPLLLEEGLAVCENPAREGRTRSYHRLSLHTMKKNREGLVRVQGLVREKLKVELLGAQAIAFRF